MSDSIIPVTDEQAKALGEGIKAARDLGGLAVQSFWRVPEDPVGLGFGGASIFR